MSARGKGLFIGQGRRLKDIALKLASPELIKFLLVSTAQAVANYGTYLLVLLVAPWWVAFACAVAVGIALQTVLQIRTTFATRMRLGTSSRYVAYQLGYLGVFAALLSLTIHQGVPPAYAPLVVLAIVTPANFVLTRWVITRRSGSAATGQTGARAP